MNPFSKYKGILLNGQFFTKEELEPGEKVYGRDSFTNDILSFAGALFSSSSDLIFHTSGSTGKPKELSFSREAIYKSANSTNQFFSLKKGNKALLSLPIEYVAGKIMIARAIAGEYELLSISPSAKPLKEDLRFDFAPFTPHQFENILARQISLLPPHSIILLGGSSVSRSLIKKIKRLPNPVYLGFGMTETLTHFAVANLKSDHRIFELLPGTETRIDREGILSIFREGITDSWIETTDVVESVGDGFVWKGRKDNVINSGGVKLHPEDIEQELSPHIESPYFVYGIQDDVLGEKVVLFIEGKKQPDLTGVRFKNKYSRPKEVILLEEFLRTESGKIRRQATAHSRSDANPDVA